MAQEAAVNPNTMQRALAQPEESGLLVSQRTTGRSVTEDEQMITEARERLAKEQIEQFLENMRKLGYEPEKTLGLINGMLKEMKQ
jgi:DNA-binding transcriptional regulator YhcF (GntR family)